MKLVVRFILFVFLLATPSSVFALSPEDTVRSIIDEIRLKQSLVPIAERMDWQKQFDAIPQEHRKVLGFSSAESMKNYYIGIAESHGQNMVDRYKEKEEKATPERRLEAKKFRVLVEDTLRQQRAEFVERVRGTAYDVGPATIQGNAATLTLTKSFADESNVYTIELTKSDDGWLVVQGADLNPLPKGFGTNTPIGVVLSPDFGVFER